MVCTYNRILFGHKKEWSYNTCYNMDEFWQFYATWNKPDTKGQRLHECTYVKYQE